MPKATSAAHIHMMKTARRWECPISSSRWCRCCLSGANGDRPARVRRTTARVRSTIGTIRIETGSSSGSSVGSRLAREPSAPWLRSGPENWPVSVSALAESTRPISIEPLSPMNSRAGWKLCGRKPAHAPASEALSSAPVVASETPLRLASW